MTALRTPLSRRAFTLVELLVVIAIVGVLVGLTIPAVQHAREAARRTSCQNNLKQVGLALHSFHASRNAFPAGSDNRSRLEHSWVTHLLPQLEQQPLYDRFDFTQHWMASGPGVANRDVADHVLSVLRCPSSIMDWPGDSDYGGLLGSSLSGLPFGNQPGQAWSSGVLIEVDPQQPQPVNVAQIIDGTSQTILVTESVDRPPSTGSWASGTNCFAHENGPINFEPLNGISSWHTGCAVAVMADGSVRLLTTAMDLETLGALCTRNGNEVVRLSP